MNLQNWCRTHWSCLDLCEWSWPDPEDVPQLLRQKPLSSYQQYRLYIQDNIMNSSSKKNIIPLVPWPGRSEDTETLSAFAPLVPCVPLRRFPNTSRMKMSWTFSWRTKYDHNRRIGRALGSFALNVKKSYLETLHESGNFNLRKGGISRI